MKYYTSNESLIKFRKECLYSNKSTIIFFWSDSDEEVDFPNAYVFRTSLYKSSLGIRVFSMPCWQNDLTLSYQAGSIKTIQKTKKPLIGFRGQAEPFSLPVKERLKKAANRVSHLVGSNYGFREYYHKGHQLRSAAMHQIKKSPDIDTDFQILTEFGGDSRLSRRENTKLYVDNIFNNQYNLCIRGGGNYSYRLYEVLSAGRIPVILNTDLVLPYDFLISWKEFCVWVEMDELAIINEKILKFHEQLSESEFVDLQIKIRKVWLEWISPLGFFKNLEKHFHSQNMNTVV
ncbi:MAG: exostosin family protein [Imperialibacter sp.]|uniref:exostosin domain-containing protein n=1 Tax=Imperialibacter sp. TaxID=2038411 RepID=UPI0032ED00AB